ncbi:hypothetical protein [Acidocella sp.]|uniref:hypothetical protein n=1 Tax=Acidocella sp. TaxID=50710 RepID=UPI00260FD07E|nr:hypothetical protein [Acidocella sp.]
MDAAQIYQENLVVLQIRQMGLIYDMNSKERGATILVPTTMTEALGALVALSAAQNLAAPNPVPMPPAGSVPLA